MLVLSRKPGESIRLGDSIEVVIISVEGHRVRIGVNAPRDIRILRSEVDPLLVKSNQAAAASANVALQQSLLSRAAAMRPRT